MALNNKYIIRIEHPLLRPGLSIETESSEKYTNEVLRKVMEIAREHNRQEASLEIIKSRDRKEEC
jgi:hypothetical protein